MATRSTIAIEKSNGQVEKIYCHWDGYLDNNGEILRKHYANPDKVQRLIDMGDLSCLGVDIGEKHQFADAAGYQGCTFYGRDRGETGVDKRVYKNFDEYKSQAQFEEYNYILRKDGVWLVEYYATNGRHVPLEDAFNEQAALED